MVLGDPAPGIYSILAECVGTTAAVGPSPLTLSYSVKLHLIPRHARIFATRAVYSVSAPQGPISVKETGGESGDGGNPIIPGLPKRVQALNAAVPQGGLFGPIEVTATFGAGSGTFTGPVGGYGIFYEIDP